MIKVKVTHPYDNWPLSRQTPKNSGIWGQCQFFINDDIKECDYWFVLDDVPNSESTICNPRNTIIITLEFPSIRPSINVRFLKQFNTIFTYSRKIKHPNVIDILSPFPWHIGVDNTNANTVDKNYKIYDSFKGQSILDKPKLISVISSNKAYTEGHKQRLKFVEALKSYFGETIDVYGRGINTFADKWEAIAPYKYHVAIENSTCKNGISEKLYDCFLGEAFPFYYGCPNANTYFSKQSFMPIDINDIEYSLKIIESSISNQDYDKSLQYIQESKTLVLDNYNIFNLMENYCSKNFSSKQSKSCVTLKPESFFIDSNDSGKKSIFDWLKLFKDW